MTLVCPDATLRRDPRFTHISGRFRYQTSENQPLTFIWDGAAISEDGNLLLIEEEICSPVDIHIQGHVTRIAYQVKQGVQIHKVIWVTKREYLQRLMALVETWRQALVDAFEAQTPPCDYLSEDGTLLATSSN